MPKLILNETLPMCSGVCCTQKESCYRYRLNQFFDYPGRKRQHQNPEWLEPRCKNGKCKNFLEIRYQSEDK